MWRAILTGSFSQFLIFLATQAAKLNLVIGMQCSENVNGRVSQGLTSADKTFREYFLSDELKIFYRVTLR